MNEKNAANASSLTSTRPLYPPNHPYARIVTSRSLMLLLVAALLVATDRPALGESPTFNGIQYSFNDPFQTEFSSDGSVFVAYEVANLR